MQALGGVAVSDFKAKDQRVRQKLELYVGSSWVDITSLAGNNYLKSLSVQLGGAGASPDPIAASWSAVIANDDNVFHPHHPTSPWSAYFRLGRKVRISIGGNYGGSDYFWQRVIGYMDTPRFSVEGQALTISGSDYMVRLTDYSLRSPDNYWGADVTFSSVATVATYASELYTEADVLDKNSEADNITNWSMTGTCFTKLTDGDGGSTYVAVITKPAGSTYCYAYNINVASVTQGTQYEVQFGWMGGGSGQTLTCQLYSYADGLGAQMGQVEGLAGVFGEWHTQTFHCVATQTGTAGLEFRVDGPSAGALAFRIDEVSIRVVNTMANARYPMPAACNGIYYVTYDNGDGNGAVPMWYGDNNRGWFHDTANNVFYFDDKMWIVTGTTNVKVYYFTTQNLIDIVGDVLFAAGLYASRAAALAAMSYTDPAITLGKVWFDTGTTAIEALRLLAERCNYRFWFGYDGTPCFQPAPTAAAVDYTMTDFAQIATAECYQDLGEVYNSVAIEGIEQNMFSTAEDKQKSCLAHVGSDATSIATYNEHTLSIKNHFFQVQATLDAMVDTLLSTYKDPKWYLKLDASFFPAPLELGDTLAWTMWFSSLVSAYQWGIIRNIEIADGRVAYTVEIAPAWPGPVFAEASMPTPVVLIGGAVRNPQSVMTATADMPAPTVAIT